MSKISCDICCDLIPLVKDGVASHDSINAVNEHISECNTCINEYNSSQSIQSTKESVSNDNLIILKIKKYLFVTAIVIIAIGMLVGVALSESMGMFYNILILPAVGVLGFFALRKKAWLIPVSLFVVVYFWHLVKYLIGGIAEYGSITSIFVMPLYWAFLYSFLCVAGVAIGLLLYISFRKEKREKNGDKSDEKMD